MCGAPCTHSRFSNPENKVTCMIPELFHLPNCRQIFICITQSISLFFYYNLTVPRFHLNQRGKYEYLLSLKTCSSLIITIYMSKYTGRSLGGNTLRNVPPDNFKTVLHCGTNKNKHWGRRIQRHGFCYSQDDLICHVIKLWLEKMNRDHLMANANSLHHKKV